MLLDEASSYGAVKSRARPGALKLLLCTGWAVSLVLLCELTVLAMHSATLWYNGECCELVRHPYELDRIQFQCGVERRLLDVHKTVVPSMLCFGFRAV